MVSIEPSAQLVYTPYNEGTLDDNDLIATSMPLKLARKSHAMTCDKSRELDKDLLEGLARVGFKLDFGEDNTGWQFKYLTRGGGYYFNVGCSDLIIKGEIALRQFADIDTFVAEGARMKDGKIIAADLIVLATGYKRQEDLVRKLFGDEVADRVGPIWGFGENQELRNMYVRTGQPGLWFIAGGLAQCRIDSKYLALQIKAIEEGLIPRVAASSFLPFSPCGRRWRGLRPPFLNRRRCFASAMRRPCRMRGNGLSIVRNPSPVSISLRSIEPPSPTRGEGRIVPRASSDPLQISSPTKK